MAWSNNAFRVAQCRRQADRLRYLAITERDADLRRRLFELAAEYEEMAEEAEADDPLLRPAAN